MYERQRLAEMSLMRQCQGCWHQRELWAVVWTVSSHKVEAAPVVATISWSPPCHNQYCTLYCITNTLPCRLQTHCLMYLFTLIFYFIFHHCQVNFMAIAAEKKSIYFSKYISFVFKANFYNYLCSKVDYFYCTDD